MYLDSFNVNKKLNEGLKPGADPDKYSKDLKKYHIFIWSNRKFNGINLVLESGYNNKMIYLNNGLKIVFTPDSFTNAFIDSKRAIYAKNTRKTESELIDCFCKEDSEIKLLIEKYICIDYTIGSSIIFPVSINDIIISWTINKARGMIYNIHDRTDYTLECIKRYYDKNMDNPLQSSLDNNKEFFSLFSSFKEYIDFFFLNDLVDEEYNVISFTGKIDFSNPFPNQINDYKEYIKNIIKFIENRNIRINKWYKELQLKIKDK